MRFAAMVTDVVLPLDDPWQLVPFAVAFACGAIAGGVLMWSFHQ